MNELIQFLSESNNFALILSALVSISATICSTVTAIQQRTYNYREKTMGMYFEKQLNAYTELLDAAAELERDMEPTEIKDLRRLIAAAKKAEMLSPDHVAAMIDDFCSFLIDFIEKEDSAKITPADEKEFKEELHLLMHYLREELMRFDPQYKYSKKDRIRLNKSFKKSV